MSTTNRPGSPLSNDERCDITELYTAQCAHCRRIPDPRPKKSHGIWFEARYVGRCQECDYPIMPGERIRTFGEGYLCTDCGKDFDLYV